MINRVNKLLLLIFVLIIFSGCKNNNLQNNSINFVLNKSEVTLSIGYSTGLKIITDKVNKDSIIWISSNNQIATVDKFGNVKAVNLGTALIKAYYVHSDGKKYKTECKINVVYGNKNINLSNISFLSRKLLITKGERYKLLVQLEPSDGYVTDIQYISDNKNIITVNENGYINTLNIGLATVKVLVNGTLSDDILVEVIDKKIEPFLVVDPDFIHFKNSKIEIKVGDITTLPYECFPENSYLGDAVWKSSAQNIVSVNSHGVIKALMPGFSIITLQSKNGVSAIAVVNVIENAKEILLDVDSIRLNRNETKKVNARILPETALQNVKWISENPNIATVNESGLITGKSDGKTIIRAITNNGLEGKINVSVIVREEYLNNRGNRCLTPYTCFKQGDYFDNFCATDKCGPIYRTGCSITSWSTIISMYIKDSNGKPIYNPQSLNRLMKNQNLCSTYCSGDVAARRVFNYLGLKTSQVYKTKDLGSEEALKKHLEDGNPALLRVGKGCYTSGGHLMAILGINDQGNIWLYDPSVERDVSNIWISYQKLLECCGPSSWFMLVGPKIN